MQFATMLKGVALLATSSMVLSASLPVRDDSSTLATELMGRDANPLQSRDDNGFFCTPVPGQPWNSVDYASVSQAIISLSNSAQQFTIGGGPGYCVGLSCEGDAGIYICNDNPGLLTVSALRLVQMAQGIQSVCYQYVDGIGAFTGGQLFDTGNFNVIVEQANCGQFGKREELNAPAEVTAREAEVSVPVPAEELAPRFSERSPSGLLCIKDNTISWNWSMVAVNGPILDSILALQNGYNGAISLFPGPRYCQQVSCTEAAALYACNDNPSAYVVNTDYLASMARDIYDNCWAVTEWGEYTGGQEFDSVNFNVIMNQSPCLGGVPRMVKREELMAPRQGVVEREVISKSIPALSSRASAGDPYNLMCILDDLPSWEWANYEASIWGAVYLEAINTDINVPAWTCLQVFCEADTAIYVCNPNQRTLVVQSNDDIAPHVESIAELCKVGDNTGGQVWDTDGYYVQLHGDTCP